MTSPARKRKTIFLALCLACAAGVTGYLYWIRQQLQPWPGQPAAAFADVPSETRCARMPRFAVQPERPSLAPPSEAARQEDGRVQAARIFFRYTGVDSNYGKLAFVERWGA